MLTNRALAPTTFIAAPDATLAAPDVYEIQSDAVINNTQSIDPDKVTNDLLANMKGGNAMAAGLPGLNSLTTVDGPTTLTSYASGGSESFTSLINSKGTGLEQIGDWKSQVKITSGGVDVTGMSRSSSDSGGFLSSLSSELKSAVTGGQSLLTSLKSGLASIPGMNANNMAQLGTLLGSKGVPASLTALITKPLGSNLGSVATINGVSSNVSSSNLANFSAIAKLINTAVGSSGSVTLVNKDATSQLMSALTGIGSANGINNAFSSTLPLAGGDKSIISSAAITSLVSAAKTGNWSAMANIATSAGASAVNGVGKSALSSAALNYSSNPYSAAEQRQAFSDAQVTLTTVNPSWLNDDRYKLDPLTHQQVLDFPVVDASLVQTGSSDFSSMMCSGAITSNDPDMKYLAMASAFPTSSPEAELAKSFPSTVTSVNTVTVANTDAAPVVSNDNDYMPYYGTVGNYNKVKDTQQYSVKGIAGF